MAYDVRVLDLFCGGGGASVGAQRACITHSLTAKSLDLEVAAGFANFAIFDGVDIKPQSEYPFRFIQADALEYLRNHHSEYQFIHASPPCQGYSKHVSSRSSKHSMTKGKDEPRLISVLRVMLEATGKPYCIENVTGALDEMNPTLYLCGTMFGLPISRHRYFETNFPVKQLHHPQCSGVAKRYAKKMGWEYRDMSVTGKGRRAGTTERWKKILDVNWDVTQRQLAEMIPPAYMEYVMGQYLEQA